MHRHSIFKYLAQTDYDFYMDNFVYLIYQGERKVYSLGDLEINHFKTELIRRPSEEVLFLKKYWDQRLQSNDEILIWDKYARKWEKASPDEIFIEYCRSSIQV